MYGPPGAGCKSGINSALKHVVDSRKVFVDCEELVALESAEQMFEELIELIGCEAGARLACRGRMAHRTYSRALGKFRTGLAETSSRNLMARAEDLNAV